MADGIMRIDGSALRVEEAPRRLDAGRLIDAWRQAHFAAQAAAELGKSWAEEKDDDSHSSFAWARADGWRGLEGVAATGDRPLRARLRFGELELSLHGGRAPVASLGLAGRTLSEAMEWMGATCERELGPRLRSARPAPDLPDHPLARGARFEVDENALLDLAGLYDATARVLEALRGAAPAFDAARCWPHHFDLASLAVAERDGAGEMTKTVGVGVTPPDSVDDAGYVYVSPWTRDGIDGTPTYPGLTDGRWLERGGGVSMAVLPVSDLAAAEDIGSTIGAFVAESFNACVEVLRG